MYVNGQGAASVAAWRTANAFFTAGAAGGGRTGGPAAPGGNVGSPGAGGAEGDTNF